MKTKTKKQRNGFVIPAKQRNSSGPMRDKRRKRENGKNKQDQYISEDY